jgi:hypothetical protein
MNKLVYILFIAFAVNSCKKADFDERDKYVGTWNFEVIYETLVNDSVQETVVTCQGLIKKGGNQSALNIQHGINDYLNLTINSEGVVRGLNHKILGIIDHESCLIVNNSPKESSIDRITIKGVR